MCLVVIFINTDTYFEGEDKTKTISTYQRWFVSSS